MKCRHNHTWIVFSGNGEWCYECGALRMMQHIKGTTNQIAPLTRWVKPVGKDGENPYKLWDKQLN